MYSALEICNKVREMCEKEGLDFFFCTEGVSSWSVNSNSDEHLRRLVVLHEKDIDKKEYELEH